MTRCAKCAEPSDAVLCHNCTTGLRVELVTVPGLLADLEITGSRLDQLTDPRHHVRGGGETPLPFKAHIGEVLWVLHHTLYVWATALEGGQVSRKFPKGVPSVSALSRWLLTNTHYIRVRDDAGQLADEVTHAIRYARRAIDRPDDRRLFLGHCGEPLPDRTHCREEVYGVPWRATATCPHCGAQHHVGTRQEWLKDLAQDHLGTATEISGFLATTGITVTASAIRNYAARGRLAPAPDTRPPLYRIRDVLAALEDRYVCKAKRKRAG